LAEEIAAGFGPRDEAPLSIVAYAADAVVGGLNGATHWGWCYIRHLWVREDWRRRGLGLRLLAEAERHTRARHCAGVYVDTFDSGAARFRAYRRNRGFSARAQPHFSAQEAALVVPCYYSRAAVGHLQHGVYGARRLTTA
jgi:GNAT superfamily N-acetyltransferase